MKQAARIFDENHSQSDQDTVTKEQQITLYTTALFK